MLRNLHTKLNTAFKQNSGHLSTWKEIKIPVSWGHIAGKWWGPLDKRPILVCHGWLDNSGSFDRLIPMLPKDNSFLAIDFPGCGYSSKFPPGLFYHLADLTFIIRRIVTYFGWSKVSLMGHSMGAGTSYRYAMFFPDEVDFLICLDLLKPLAEDKTIDFIRNCVDRFLRYDQENNTNREPYSYSFKEMEEKMHKHYNSIDLEKCKYILERNIRPSSENEGKFYFSIDPRMKVYNLLDNSQAEWLKYASCLTCPICYCKTDKGPYFEKKEYVFDLIDAIKKHNKDIEVHFVEGSHHLHLNNPECLIGILTNFLKKYDVGDRLNSGLKPENLV